MDVAVSTIDITPNFKVQLYGYESRKNRKTKKVLDPILLTGIAMRDGDREAFILSFDLCLFDDATHGRLVSELRQLGISRDQVILSCTHTHCGPVCSRNPIFRGDPGPYIEFLVLKVRQAIGELRRGYTTGCQLFYGEGTTGVPKNRTSQHGISAANPGGNIDPVVNVLVAKTEEGEMLAVIFRISCHATLLQDIMQISADLPGSARGHLLEQLQHKNLAKPRAGLAILFLQGFCGDANPRERGSTKILESLGSQVASDVLGVIEHGLMSIEPELRYHLDYLDIPCDAESSMEKVPAVRSALKHEETKLVDTIRWPIHVLQVARQTLIIACGGEVVHEVATMARDVFHDFKVVLVGYTGEYHTYIATENHFRPDSYEALGVIKYTNLAGPLDRLGLDARLRAKFVAIHDVVEKWLSLKKG